MNRAFGAVESSNRRVLDLQLFVEVPDLTVSPLPHHFYL
jgi:hypothetical protein